MNNDHPGIVDDKTDENKQAEVFGEGNYTATRRYDEATRKFVESGQVEQAAKDAAPHNEQEAREMQQAETIGKSHAHGEDPNLYSATGDHEKKEEQRKTAALAVPDAAPMSGFNKETPASPPRNAPQK